MRTKTQTNPSRNSIKTKPLVFQRLGNSRGGRLQTLKQSPKGPRLRSLGRLRHQRSFGLRAESCSRAVRFGFGVSGSRFGFRFSRFWVQGLVGFGRFGLREFWRLWQEEHPRGNGPSSRHGWLLATRQACNRLPPRGNGQQAKTPKPSEASDSEVRIPEKAWPSSGRSGSKAPAPVWLG